MAQYMKAQTEAIIIAYMKEGIDIPLDVYAVIWVAKNAERFRKEHSDLLK